MTQDSLDQYNAKRDFKLTKEPAGKAPKKSGKETIFVVQKHAATRLHWDFRLEMHGVLKSWAVTNEPVADPAVKRLAVRVEDHPLSYATFAGDIPKGQYGGGHVDIWDNGTWEPVGDADAGLRDGKLSFILHGTVMRGHWTLVRMRDGGKRQNWLLIKGKDEDAALPTPEKKRVKRLPPAAVLKGSRSRSTIPFDPVLAQRVDTPPAGDNWLHEIKYDGYRALLVFDKGKTTIVTRNGLDWSERFPDIVTMAEKIGIDQIAMDGEIVVFNDDGKTSFSALQQTLAGEARHRMVFVAFDLLALAGKDLRKLSLLTRKEKLQALLAGKKLKDIIRYSDHVTGNGKKLFAEAIKLGLEGIISKRADSSYQAGRNGSWLKIKHIQVEEFVIGGILRRSDDANKVGAVLLGQFEDGKFAYKGKSGTGFPKAVSDDLLKRAAPLTIPKSPFETGSKPRDKHAEWLKPKLVCMIDYTEMTADSQVRHGVFQGLREDKPAADVKLEKTSAPPAARPDESVAKTKFSGISITHPARIVYSENGYTKADIAAYYDTVAAYMLPFLRGRPVSIIRCPDGLVKKCFFQRHVSGKAAEHVTILDVRDTESGDPYFSIDSKQGLLSLVQFGAIEFHAWGSQAPRFDKADRLVFDLDPDPKIDLPSVKAATLLVRDRLKGLGLESFLKTTGGKGLHVVVPITPEHDWAMIKKFARDFVEHLEKDFPKAFVTVASKEKRKGRIFLDYLRNEETSTSIVPFSLRARVNAPLAIPLPWTALTKLAATDYYNLGNYLDAVKKKWTAWPTFTPQKLDPDVF